MSQTISTIFVVLLASLVVGDHDYYCPQPEVPTHGYISKGKQSSYRVGSRVEYSCKYGYKLWGERRIRCVRKGEVEYWDDPAPECKKDGCGYLDDPDYGYVRQSGKTVGATATYSCRDGYKLKGYSKRRCQYNGYWSGEEPKCIPVRCEDLGDPDYGTVKQSGNHVDAKATYSCDYGYTLDGPRERKCLDTGYWSGKEPECKKSGCEDLPHPDYGRVSQYGKHVGAKATYKCDYGYKLHGPSERECLRTGYWSEEEPECKKIGCEKLPHPDYGEVKQTGNHIGAKATYKCDYGYTLYGDRERTCLKSGYWSDEEPECKKSGCKDLTDPEDGSVKQSGNHVGAKATYSCYYGYKLVGPNTRKCLYNGDWSDKEPECLYVRECEKPSNPRYGRVYIYGTYAVYRCYDGYQLVGSYYRICQNGYWSHKAPRCVRRY